MLETVPGAVKRFLEISNCSFECDHYYCQEINRLKSYRAMSNVDIFATKDPASQAAATDTEISTKNTRYTESDYSDYTEYTGYTQNAEYITYTENSNINTRYTESTDHTHYTDLIY